MKINSPKVKELKYAKDGQEYRSFQVVWNDREGKRQRKQFIDRSEAVLFASETHTALLNNGASHRSLSTVLTEPLVREAEICITRLSPKYSLTEATDFFLKHFKDPAFKISIGDAVIKFLGAKEGVVRDRSLRQFKSTFGQFERFAQNCYVHEVNHDTVELFLQSLRSKDGVKKAARKTWNNYRADLHLLFEWCREKPQQYVSGNPVTDIKRFEIDRGEVDALSANRAEELMRYVENFKDGKLVRFFALALFAGIRPEKAGELGKLAEKPSAIDFENKVIKLSASMAKTRRPRPITIQPNLLQWLSRYDGDIFPVNYERETRAVRLKFGLTRDILRHTFVTMHVMAFDSFAQTAIQAGNSETIIRDDYLNVTTKVDAERFWRILPKGGEAKVLPFVAVER
jgi:hypothetical protein